ADRDRSRAGPRASAAWSARSCRHVAEQRLDPGCEVAQLGVGLGEWPRRGVGVGMAGEGDLVAGLRLAVVDPGVRDVRPDLALEVRVDVLVKADVLVIAQVGVW